MKPRILSLLAVGLLAVPVAGTVSAATIIGSCTTWTQNDVNGGYDESVISCPTFNSTLGQLTDIAFSMFGSGTGAAIHVENNGSSVATTDALLATIELFMVGEGIDLYDLETFPFAAQTVQPGASFDLPPFGSSRQWSGSVAESVWGSYQSAFVGPEVDGGFLTAGRVRLTGFPRCDFVDDLCGKILYTDLLFTGELTYTYQPFVVPVPEPGTFTLLVLGLAGLGLVRRRKA